ncbi:putative PurR-regulated permease PerM [Paucibacter oligotrophus]|uniref:Putative PurR-regulated permease PerM n=1 Tax=Roseateles oligotrophus TaxID=1769250 RepID=A0A840L8L8_9BURK|nr:AI-2E family transporter [Roseateles oligotrophus]MBB4841727.1 putative PurR-regulated permease PerM [Roseateles oligotrophus]
MPSTDAASPLIPKILAGTAVLGFLYLAGGVLAPITLAIMLSFVIAPIVRRFRGLGLGQGAAALLALGMAGLVTAGIALVIVLQLRAMSEELPAYEAQVRQKIATLRELTVDRLQEAQGRASRMMTDQLVAEPDQPQALSPDKPRPEGKSDPLAQFLALVWGPLGGVGVVVLVLVFALLEQDALRDRLVRLLGGSDVRAATSALNDAGQRLSRYFVSQFSVNLGVALAIWALLALLQLPHALIWATLAGLLRFVPYVGFPAAALLACAMAAAMVPGWDMALSTALVFLAVELVVTYGIEPRLYGHATGMSPFSVVVSAIFWSALWGPIGLLLSTPLTLCLVVAGRHVPSLYFLDLLLGDAPALDLSQRFYQRILSGDAVEILANARSFLKRKSLASYCDKIVMPAFLMARQDFEKQLIQPAQVQAAQRAILQVFGQLSGHARPARSCKTVLDDGGELGLRLRQERLKTEGRWQGPLDVAPGSLLLCVSMAGSDAYLTAELLVRVLRSERLDARHVTVQELADPPPDARAELIGTVFVVSTSAAPVSAQDRELLNRHLLMLQQAQLVLLMPVATQATADPIAAERSYHTAYSFEEAVALVQARQS